MRTSDRRYLQIHLVCSEPHFPQVRQVSNFLGNINRFYSVLRLATDDNYAYRSLAQSGYLLRQEDRLRIRRLSLASPLDVALITQVATGAAGAASTLALMLQGIYKLKADRGKTEAEMVKLLAEARKTDAETRKIEAETGKLLIESQTPVISQETSLASTPSTQMERLSEEQQIQKMQQALAIEPQLMERLRSRGAIPACTRVIRNLSNSEIRVVKVEVTIVSLPETEKPK